MPPCPLNHSLLPPARVYPHPTPPRAGTYLDYLPEQWKETGQEEEKFYLACRSYSSVYIVITTPDYHLPWCLCAVGTYIDYLGSKPNFGYPQDCADPISLPVTDKTVAWTWDLVLEENSYSTNHLLFQTDS